MNHSPDETKDGAAALNPFSGESNGSPGVIRERKFGRETLDATEGRRGKENGLVTPLDRQATEACDALSKAMLSEKETVEMPSCDNIEVIQIVIDQLQHTPVCLGWGQLPSKISTNWQSFVKNTIEAHRNRHELPAHELVPLTLTLPEWLQNQREFDILGDLRLVDATIIGDVSGEFASRATLCRITVKGDVRGSANVGKGAKRCSFIFEGGFNTNKAFVDASNVDILIKGAQSGRIGPITDSRVKCMGGASGDVNGDASCVLVNIKKYESYR